MRRYPSLLGLIYVGVVHSLPLSNHKRLSYRGEQGAAREAAELLGA